MAKDEFGNEIPQAVPPASATGNEDGDKTPEQLAQEEEAIRVATEKKEKGEDLTPEEEALLAPPAEKPPEGKGAEPSKAEKRIQKLVKEREDAKSRAAYWQGVAQGRGKTDEGTPPAPAATPAGPPSPPNPADYEGGIYDLKYIDDHDQYVIDTAAYRVEKRSREIAESEKAATVHTQFVNRMRAAAVDDPSVMDMMDDPSFFPHNIPAAGPIVALIKESELAPDILRHLYNDRGRLESLYRMNPLAAAREIGKIEAELAKSTKQPVRKVSQAPEPVKTVGGKGASAVIEDEDQLSTAEFMQRRNKAQFGRGK